MRSNFWEYLYNSIMGGCVAVLLLAIYLEATSAKKAPVTPQPCTTADKI